MWWYEGLKETSIDRKGENGRERESENERERVVGVGGVRQGQSTQSLVATPRSLGFD